MRCPVVYEAVVVAALCILSIMHHYRVQIVRTLLLLYECSIQLFPHVS